jgi:hypothetical protein
MPAWERLSVIGRTHRRIQHHVFVSRLIGRKRQPCSLRVAPAPESTSTPDIRFPLR